MGLTMNYFSTCHDGAKRLYEYNTGTHIYAVSILYDEDCEIIEKEYLIDNVIAKKEDMHKSIETYFELFN